MATRKANSSYFAHSRQPATRLDFSTGVTRIRKNGIEFHSTTPIPAWTEMTVALRDPADGQEVTATGVVVDCRGDRHQGYTVSMLFMELTPLAQARLSLMAYSNLA
jgi:hypothetical protein